MKKNTPLAKALRAVGDRWRTFARERLGHRHADCANRCLSEDEHGRVTCCYE